MIKKKENKEIPSCRVLVEISSGQWVETRIQLISNCIFATGEVDEEEYKLGSLTECVFENVPETFSIEVQYRITGESSIKDEQ